MTIERSVVISREDVRAVIFQCATCGGGLVVPIGKPINPDKLAICPYCAQPWLGYPAEKQFVADVQRPEVTKALATFLFPLQGTGKPEDKDAPFKIRLELAEPH